MIGISSKNIEHSNIQSREPVTNIAGNLPVDYGDLSVILLPRDPLNIFSYWELPKYTIIQMKQKYESEGCDKSKFILRIFDSGNENKYFDIQINSNVGSWYIRLPEENRDWYGELGLLLPDNRFIRIKRSNMAHMPRNGISEATDEKWATTGKMFEEIFEVSGLKKLGKASFDFAKEMHKKWQQLMSVSSGSGRHEKEGF